MTVARFFSRVSVVAVGCLFAAQSHAGEIRTCDPAGFYDEVLPATVTEADMTGADEVIVIRYVPGDTSIAREYRIKIIASADGKIAAWRVDPVSASMRQQLRTAEDRAPNAGCAAWLSEIRLETHRFNNQKTLNGLLEKLNSVRVAARQESAIYLDAPQYEITLWEKMNSAHFVVYDARSTRARPLIEWAKQVSGQLAAPKGVLVR
jgi:hypothetical protein